MNSDQNHTQYHGYPTRLGSGQTTENAQKRQATDYASATESDSHKKHKPEAIENGSAVLFINPDCSQPPQMPYESTKDPTESPIQEQNAQMDQGYDKEESAHKERESERQKDKQLKHDRLGEEQTQIDAKLGTTQPGRQPLGSPRGSSLDKNKQGIGQALNELPVSSLVAISHDTNADPPISMELQPETRPISLSQLVNEVKGIYVGLVMVETKCIEVDSEKGGVGSNPQTKFTDEQWKALITLHRTLLHEHHDFMLASQHPSASPALRRLALKYAMPARMWRHGIHSFLELLRHRLPDSQEHMVTFIYLAYSMMALLYETVPAFEDTWVECLGDLSRYRMAIEDDNQRVRDTWTLVSAGWYTIASNHAPTTGRLYHHLAILARPHIVTQLYLYLKSLCVPVPFTATRESILTLLEPILNNKPPAGVSEFALFFVTLHAILFTGKSNTLFSTTCAKFLKALDRHITASGKNWIETGAHIAMINSCALLSYGADDNVLMKFLRQPKTSSTNAADGTSNADSRSLAESSSIEPPSRAQTLTTDIDRIVFSRLGDPTSFGYIHARLVWLVEMAQLPGAMRYLERYVAWPLLVDYLNDSIATYIQYERLEMDTVMISPSGSHDNMDKHSRPVQGQTPKTSAENNTETVAGSSSRESELAATDAPSPDIAKPPRPRSVEERPLPEDWKHRGMIYAQNTFPTDWFGDIGTVDDGERLMETPAMTAIRKERILWLAVRLTRFSANILYDKKTHRFSMGEYATDGRNTSTRGGDEGVQDEDDDDINLSDMETLAYSAKANMGDPTVQGLRR